MHHAHKLHAHHEKTSGTSPDTIITNVIFYGLISLIVLLTLFYAWLLLQA